MGNELPQDGYLPVVGLVYIFNLIVGTGALTLPKGFSDAGWLLSLIVIFLLCIISFITVTFVIESMSIANAVLKTRTRRGTGSFSARCHSKSVDTLNDSGLPHSTTNSVENLGNQHDEKLPLIQSVSNTAEDSSSSQPVEKLVFDVTRTVELGEMAKMFFPKLATTFFYFCIAVYLYGDLAIYCVAIAKSLRDVTCTYHSELICNTTLDNHIPCSSTYNQITRQTAFRLYVMVVFFCLGPFAFFNVQKTKYLQIATSLLRWIAFISMSVLALITLFKGEGRGRPDMVNFKGIPSLFGLCVYSFMCHHSIPSLITPINKKKNLFWLIFADYGLILSFYSLLSLTGIFAFQHIEDVYTLDFQRCSDDTASVPQVRVLQYFLPLFPVFTLSTSFPVISITLRNNLKTLFTSEDDELPPPGTITWFQAWWHMFVRQVGFPLLAVIPPTLIALATEDVESLVSVVGSYAGASIQYIIPALLVLYSRRHLNRLLINDEYFFGLETKLRHRFESPFKSRYWVYFILVWSVLCMVIVSVNLILTKVVHT